MDFVADNVESTDGAGIIDSITQSIKAGGEEEAWDTAAQAGGATLESLGFITDPFGSLISAGIGWAIEHCEPLRLPLDQLAGDPRAIKDASQDWHTRSEELTLKAQDIRRAAQDETADWEGTAANAYRKAANALADFVDEMGTGSTGVAGAIHGAGVLVGTIRGMIRDIIADFVAAAIQKLAVSMGLSFITAGASIGAGVAWLVGKVGITIGKVTQKLSDAVSKLSDLLGNLGRLGQALGDVGARAARLASTGATKIDNMAGAVGSSSMVRNSFNGSIREAVDSPIRRADDYTSSTGFDFNRQSGNIEFGTNPRGDAIKAASEINKNAAKVDGDWEEQRNQAEQEARSE